MSDPYDYYDGYDDQEYRPPAEEEEPEDDSGKRTAWEILSWIALALTLILNLVVIVILVVRRNAFSVVNKGI